MRWLLVLSLLLAPVAAAAKPLTVKVGESWAFQIYKGDPVKARKVAGSAKPAKGEIMVTLKSFLGTMLTAVNGTGRGWTFKAELLNGGKASPARTCTLPTSRIPTMEQWQGKHAEAACSRCAAARAGEQHRDIGIGMAAEPFLAVQAPALDAVGADTDALSLGLDRADVGAAGLLGHELGALQHRRRILAQQPVEQHLLQRGRAVALDHEV